MNKTRFDAIYSGLTSIAQKVDRAVPITEEWPTSQIHSELVRLGANTDRKILQGCLKSLMDAGLVTESAGKYYRRVEVRNRAASSTSPAPEPEIEAPPTPAPAAPTTPFGKLAALAAKARELAKSLHELAEEIENAALDVEAQAEANSAELQKVKQLKAILHSLS